MAISSAALPPLTTRGAAIVERDSGRPVTLRGVNRSGLEYVEPPPAAGTVARADAPAHAVARAGAAAFLDAARLTPDELTAIAGWGANILRLPFNQAFALDGRAGWPAEAYLTALDTTIAWAAARGLYTLLDLQWLDADTPRGTDPRGVNHVPSLPDERTIDLWRRIAARYRDDPAVLFDLFNEPHDPLADDPVPLLGVGRGGDPVPLRSRKVTMAEWQPWALRLAGAIRGEHPGALVFASGVRWAFDLRGFPLRDPAGQPLPGIVYSAHVYPWSRIGAFAPRSMEREWTRAFGHLAGEVPLFVAEWGGGPEDVAWGRRLLDYLDRRGIGWAAWSWADWPWLVRDQRRGDFAPTAFGDIVRSRLEKAGAHDERRG